MTARTRTFATSRPQQPGKSGLADRLAQVVDVCLAALVLFAPYFLGGRHPVGQFVFVVLSVVMASAWCCRQWLEKNSGYRFSGVELLLIAAILVVAAQIIPFPSRMLNAISPATQGVLSAGTAGGASTTWSTISLAPGLTRDALAVLIAHALVLLVVIQRARTLEDVQRLLWLLAGAAVLMAGGLVWRSAQSIKNYLRAEVLPRERRAEHDGPESSKGGGKTDSRDSCGVCQGLRGGRARSPDRSLP